MMAQPRLAFPMHPHLYEINTWVWLEELSARYGGSLTLGKVPDQEWDKLQRLGFDFVWLMGIWKRSAIGRRIFRTDPLHFPIYDVALPGWTMNDVVGSPYAIQDYTPDPRLATWDELDAARLKLHARNMGLILDFVPNHTALDHPWINAHPDYYVQGSLPDFRMNPPAFFLVERENSTLFIARGKDPYFPAWPDTAQLNYYNPGTRAAMLDVLGRIAQHCDGVRCDMAMLSLNDVFERTWGPWLSSFATPRKEFWPEGISGLPGFVWIGEVYWGMEWRMQQLGFNYTYDKQLYDRLLNAAARDVRVHLQADVIYQKKLVRFLENHDEARAASAFGKEKLPAVSTMAGTLPGLRFYHHGQLEGKKLHLPIQLGRAAAEAADVQVQALYDKLLAITREDVFHQGEWTLLEARPAGDSTFENLVAYRWQSAKALKLVVVNLGSVGSQGRISLGPWIEPSRHYMLLDQLNDGHYDCDGQDLAQGGLFVRLDRYGSHIFDVSPPGRS